MTAETYADQVRYDAAIELLAARNALNEAAFVGLGTRVHKQRVDTAERVWDAANEPADEAEAA